MTNQEDVMLTNEYRITRPDLYPLNSIGYRDRTARQGHYYEAETADEALEKARRDFPGENLEVEFWRQIPV